MARARTATEPMIECPRCGYDVSGVMSTWATECPVEGTCSECGYEFQWKHLLGANLGVPKWFFETAQRKKIRAAISTSVRTVAPWRFWRDVPLHAPMSRGRLVVISAGSLIVAYGFSIVALSADYLFRVATSPWSKRWSISLSDRIKNILYLFRHHAMWPSGNVTPKLPRDFEFAVHWLLLTSLVLPVCFLTIRKTLRTVRVRPVHLARSGAYAFVAVAIALSIWFAFFAAEVVWEQWAGTRLPVWFQSCMNRAVVFWPIVSVLWWWCVCQFYLCIRHAFWVALAMQVMAILAAAVVLYPLTRDEMAWYRFVPW